jgi:hypothetical protein
LMATRSVRSCSISSMTGSIPVKRIPGRIRLFMESSCYPLAGASQA